MPLCHSAHPTEAQLSVLAWDHDIHDDLISRRASLPLSLSSILVPWGWRRSGRPDSQIPNRRQGPQPHAGQPASEAPSPLEAQARGPGRRGPGAIALWEVPYTASAGAHTLGAAGRGQGDGAPEEGAEPAPSRDDLGSTGSFAVKPSEGVLNR